MNEDTFIELNVCKFVRSAEARRKKKIKKKIESERNRDKFPNRHIKRHNFIRLKWFEAMNKNLHRHSNNNSKRL